MAMRKLLGFAVLFMLGFATGAYVLNTYFPNRGLPTQAAFDRDRESHRVELTRLLEQRSAVPEPAPTNFETMLRIAAQRIAPAVVNVDTTGEIATWRGWREVGGRGSGVIISPDGYVVTNNHVVRIQRQVARDIFVTLQDGRRFRATVLGTDSQNDVALLKIDGKNLPVAQLGDSDKLQVGDWVIAVGNPFGLGTTVTAGIVSALNRSLEGAGVPSGFIQTDAAINQGNSGGALADSRGRLIGINTAIFSPVGANVGIGFAIPVNRVKQVIREILEHGSVGQAWIGISYADISDPQIRRFLQERLPEVRFPANGMFIDGVVANSPARSAGIQPGDVITHLNGRPLRTIEDMQNFMRRAKPGQQITLRIWRDGQTIDIKITLGVRPDDM
ncbi:MAG: 2-alkenal reductase [Armatimonadetes bacterium JP3_11]|nr:MAG: 2-alkenal reductase [Armatimonadetes bacterium CP1_7O]OYT75031.1 MAG: 2-alkenal reductase [Armatimonadetes bacterium JP3_11]